jgi:hypothetical protein
MAAGRAVALKGASHRQLELRAGDADVFELARAHHAQLGEHPLLPVPGEKIGPPAADGPEEAAQPEGRAHWARPAGPLRFVLMIIFISRVLLVRLSALRPPI